MSFLSTQSVTKSFGPVQVLHGIDFRVEPGEVVALLGENGAGKSTFVRILAGDHRADGGSIAVDGREHQFGSVKEARSAGVRLITQEISDAPTLTVAENVVLGAWPGSYGLVGRPATRKRATELLARLGAELPLGAQVGSLRLGERQIIEIARALAGESRCLIFDEPTAALSDVEANRLFSLIEGLRSDGVAIIYITHRLDEVFRIADRVCVLRDGRISMDTAVGDVKTGDVVQAMVGRRVAAQRFVAEAAEPAGRPVLKFQNASGADFTKVDVEVYAGRVTGIYGKIGSGVSEVAEAMFGLRRIESGSLQVDGKEVRLRTPADAIARGIGYLPPDRKSQAILTGRSVAENLSAPSWARISGPLGILTSEREGAAYGRWHDTLKVKSRNRPDQSIGTLSGGNQQKVLLGRWLEAKSKVLVLAEPTRGVDVGARQEIYQAIRTLAEQGSAVVVVSSDYEDIVAVADEAAVMVRGRIVTRLMGDNVNTAQLTEAAGGAVHAFQGATDA